MHAKPCDNRETQAATPPQRDATVSVLPCVTTTLKLLARVPANWTFVGLLITIQHKINFSQTEF